MSGTLRTRIGGELELGRWSPESHAKLTDFLTRYARENPGRPTARPMAIFDADNTTWAGDLGDAAIAFLVKNLKLSPRVHEVLPASIDVPAEGFGVTAARRLFAAARVKQSYDALLGAWREAFAPGAGADALLSGFSEAMVLPGGVLHENARFRNAYRVYTGTLIALYNLLDAHNGSVAFDYDDARVMTSRYPDLIRGFYGWEVSGGSKDLAKFTRVTEAGHDILFPTILDEGREQDALRAQARLGAYSQVATWVAFDKSPDELIRLGIEIWDTSPGLDSRFDVVFPVDASAAETPAALDFAGDLAGVEMGASSLSHGTKVRPEIVNLIAVMREHDITPIVITASQVDLVRSVMERFYGFGSGPMMGMVHALEGGVYGSRLVAPATYRPGKVDAARELAIRVTGDEEARPVFCAGDTNTDFEFVAYSMDYRLFFDRKKRLFMALAAYLASHGAEGSTVIQRPFESDPGGGAA